MRIITIENGNLTLKEKVLGFLERTVTPFGTSAKVDCPKRYIGKRAYLIICEDEGSL
jgi:putative transposon-encoded protein